MEGAGKCVACFCEWGPVMGIELHSLPALVASSAIHKTEATFA